MLWLRRHFRVKFDHMPQCVIFVIFFPFVVVVFLFLVSLVSHALAPRKHWMTLGTDL